MGDSIKDLASKFLTEGNQAAFSAIKNRQKVFDIPHVNLKRPSISL
jgi:hypothetical protein